MGTVESSLNKQIANWTVLYSKLHNYHWYVKGPHFFTLHGKFEELYNEAAAHVDALAERLLALGGSPVATLRQSLELSSVDEAAGKETAEEMVGQLVKDFGRIQNEIKADMELLEQSGEEGTADMYLAIHSSLQKHVWMLNAFLGVR